MGVGSEHGGYGIGAYGRCNYGHAESEHEPRFDESDPADGSVDVSIYATTVMFDVYCFSSTIVDDGSMVIEVSENNGTSYVDAYRNKVFVSPFNGVASQVDFQMGDPQKCFVVLQKTSAWANEQTVRVRVTVLDEFGNEATKEVAVKWAT